MLLEPLQQDLQRHKTGPIHQIIAHRGQQVPVLKVLRQHVRLQGVPIVQRRGLLPLLQLPGKVVVPIQDRPVRAGVAVLPIQGQAAAHIVLQAAVAAPIAGPVAAQAQAEAVVPTLLLAEAAAVALIALQAEVAARVVVAAAPAPIALRVAVAHQAQALVAAVHHEDRHYCFKQRRDLPPGLII